jgi:hypothetical protein
MKHNKYATRTKPVGQKRRTRIIPRKKPIVGKAVREELVRFREYHPVSRFSRNLRTMLIEFLMYEGAIEANYLEDLLYDLQGLFELLEVIQLENEIRGESG